MPSETSATSHPTASELSKKYADVIANKTVMVTGVTMASIGFNFALAVAAASPALIILTGRNPDKLAKTVKALKDASPGVPVRTVIVNLASIASVRKGAAEVLAWEDVPVIDAVVNNAGVMATDYALTEDGIELQFASNHIGHFLLTNLIMPKVMKSPSPRVVSVSSDGHRLSHMRWADINFDDGKTYNKWASYGQSKTANSLFAISLARKLGSKGLQAYSLHPGVIFTTSLGTHLDASEDGDFAKLVQFDKDRGNIHGWTGLKMISADEGAATHMVAAFDQNLKSSNGAYLNECRFADPYKDNIRPWATSETEAEMLWNLSEKLVGQEFKY